MEIDMELYRRQFYQEAREILDKVNEDILLAETDPTNQELLNSIFRGIHTIKGSAGGFDLGDISDFAHYIEHLLNLLREGRIPLDSGVVDLVLQGSDQLNAMIDSHEKGVQPAGCEELANRFKVFLSRTDGVSSERRTEQAAGAPLGPEHASTASLPADIDLPRGLRETLTKHGADGCNVYEIYVRYTSEVFENGYDPIVFLANLESSSSFYHAETDQGTVPSPDGFEPLRLYLSPRVYVACDLSLEEVRDIAFDPSLVSVRKLYGDDGALLSLESVDEAILGEFLMGARDMIDSAERGLIEYEKSYSRESLNEIFRSVHNLKGDSDYVGLKGLTDFAHSLETLLDNLRKGGIKRTPQIIDLLLKAVDALKDCVGGIATKTHYGKNMMLLRNRIEKQCPMGEAKKENALRGLTGEAGVVYMDQALQQRERLS